MAGPRVAEVYHDREDFGRIYLMRISRLFIQCLFLRFFSLFVGLQDTLGDLRDVSEHVLFLHVSVRTLFHTLPRQKHDGQAPASFREGVHGVAGAYAGSSGGG